jgi:hypothetical protein
MPKFNADRVAQVLDKRSPTLGAGIGAQKAHLVQSEIDALRARISSCWTPAMERVGNTSVKPEVDQVSNPLNPLAKIIG